jgi:hypothetical protein
MSSSSAAEATTTNSPNQIAGNNNNSQDLDLPKDLQSAIEKIKQLTSKRDELLHQKAKSSKELERMTKNARLAQIRTLVPRELYKHQDAYES